LKMPGNKLLLAVITMFILFVVSACGSGTSSTAAPTPVYSQYQLKYLLIQKYPDVFWCDPDYYPVNREGQEQTNSLEQFSAISSNLPEFRAILEHLNMPVKTDYSDQEKLAVYREFKKLNYAVSLTDSGSPYIFIIRVGKNQGSRIEGTINSTGQIAELKNEVSFNTCPICLTEGTLISTPHGQTAVQYLQPGMTVWTQNESGEFDAVPIVRTSLTAVPAGFIVTRITLSDGRTVSASPGHPSADMIPLGDYEISDKLDGSVVIKLEKTAYTSGFTYDLLPSGPTGVYRANGILLKSTLAR
jgi:hypothetical protein